MSSVLTIASRLKGSVGKTAWDVVRRKRLASYLKSDRRPWREGYHEYREKCLSEAVNDDSLLDTLLAINCLVNPEVILIGGRLPSSIVDRLATRLNQRLEAHAGTVPAIAPVSRAALSDDAPAVGAAILPFSHRLLPTRTALMKVAAR